MDRVFKKKEDIITRDIVGETLLVPIRGELANMQKLFALEDVAAFVWEHLDGKKALDEILEMMTTHFDVDFEEAKTDLVEFIDALSAADLIEQKK
jgi:hypothetical protein